MDVSSSCYHQLPTSINWVAVPPNGLQAEALSTSSILFFWSTHLYQKLKHSRKKESALHKLDSEKEPFTTGWNTPQENNYR